MWFYYFCKFFAMIFYGIFYPHKIYGKENMPKDDNFILVCNHYAKIDILVVSALFKKRPYFLAKKQLMDGKFTGRLLRRYGLIPIDREKVDFNAMKECFAVLKRGDNLCIFPEGTRNREDDELKELKGGAGMIALKAGVPIVPVMMLSRFMPFHKNYAIIGKPIDFGELKGQKANAEVIADTEKIIREKMLECHSDLKRLAGGRKK
ncbi:MAG: 1-acyl-sn-glycerol-3-phosphate acyltransferase [Clostridia bacterium]|nr:1-acyl-sn-glycerol-3-phosphate acyltransferase [Clostridia bacterium]